MRHIDAPKIQSFLTGLRSQSGWPSEDLQPPILGHLLGCGSCRTRIGSLSAYFGKRLRTSLYPETDCPKDSELRIPSLAAGQLNHLKECLWCALAFHDLLGNKKMPVYTNSHYNRAKVNCHRVMRAAVSRHSAPDNPMDFMGNSGIIWARDNF
jgi:hypothetical protein